jgi:hypothetical protein
MATYNGMTKAKSSFHLNRFIVTGGNASASLTCTGIKTTSKILFVFHQTVAADVASSVMVDLDAVTIYADGLIRWTTATNSDQLDVFWTDVEK